MMPRDRQHRSSTQRVLVVLLWALLAFGSATFVVRGTWKAISGGNYDFVLIYSSARAWLHGGNPYEKEDVSRAWLSSGGPAERDPMIPRGPATLVYPPPAMAVLAPIAALPWKPASFLWAMGNTALAVFSLLALGSVAQLSRTGRLALASLGMCMAPLVTNTALGQTATVVLACICGGILARVRGSHVVSGALLGIGAALKPQLGLLFAVYEAGRLRWKIAAAAGIVIGVLTAVGIGRMQAAGVDWSTSWRQNIQAFTTTDDGNASRANPIRHQVINLHYPIHNFTDERDFVRWAVLGIVGTMCLVYFVVDLRRGRHRGEPRHELVSLSFVAAVTLMITYHRYYDAAILVIPLALAVRGLCDRRPTAIATLLLVLLFALPLPVIVVEAVRRGWIPRAAETSTIGQYLVLPLQAMALAALGAWMIAVRSAARPEELTQRST
jgi:hypothetical protein